MLTQTRSDSAKYHIGAMFAAKAVQRGGVIRRNIAWADREIGRERLTAEVKNRGFHMVMCGGQYVIICDHGFLRVVC